MKEAKTPKGMKMSLWWWRSPYPPLRLGDAQPLLRLPVHRLLRRLLAAAGRVVRRTRVPRPVLHAALLRARLAVPPHLPDQVPVPESQVPQPL